MWAAATIIGGGLILSVAVGVIIGKSELWVLGGAGLAPLFAAVTIGWALGRKLQTAVPRVERIQAMRGFFLLVALACLVLAIVRAL